MIALVARPPLHILSPSAMQVGSRRLSARLQEKDETQKAGGHSGAASRSMVKGSSGPTNSKKRKNEYDEDDDGFAFSRVNKNKKSRQSKQDATADAAPSSAKTTARPVTNGGPSSRNVAPESATKLDQALEQAENSKKKRKKMSFSTPKAKEPQSVRRSKRLSSEQAQRDGSPSAEPIMTEVKSRKKTNLQAPITTEKEKEIDETKASEATLDQVDQREEPQDAGAITHSGTKIALPFADTPVIRRNKAMREGKSMKGDRRSSLGLRGRRASSLIDTGNSNALPHSEVETTDFYKHIESDIMEPRRMRQLLTWCATRAMHAKPKGTDFQDAVAKSAARVIEEELLKELSSKSELSDWFSREDIPESSKPLPERPNPKNVQNLQKIAELEEQINRLKSERGALQTLLKPPEIATSGRSPDLTTEMADIESSLLSEGDAILLEALRSTTHLPGNISQRIDRISSTVGPSVDQFADSIHRLAQYRTATDSMAGKVLSICAGKLASREKEERKKALHTEEERSPGRDLSSVLRGLSKADR